jgi:hypothetical protein
VYVRWSGHARVPKPGIYLGCRARGKWHGRQSAPIRRARDSTAVNLRERLRPSLRPALGKNRATSRDAERALAKAMRKQDERLRRAEANAVDVQLLGQVTGAAEWPKLLAHWERRNPSGVASWPRRLDPSAYALNLWPLPAGRIGPAAGLGADVRKRQPKRMLCTPGLTVFDPDRDDSDATSALAIVCASWLEDVGMSDFAALRLAPPVLEIWATAGRLISRAAVDFGLDWSLPPADGI